jgi:acetyl esterase
VEYRLAPDTPFPGPQEDCYAGLQWLVKHAAELGVDPTRIVIGGESAGGGLAAGVALMVRDRGEFSIAGQLLTYPMLDHRTGGPDDPYQNPITGEFVWTRQSNQFGWKSLQGDYQLDDERIGWFSPSRAADLTGLAPIFIATGMLDLFFDENLDYIRRATAAGVPTELHSYPGAFHAFNAVNTTTIGKQFWSDLIRGMQRLIRA